MPAVERPTVAAHWGLYRAHADAAGEWRLAPFENDGDPSPIGAMMTEARLAPARILRPHVRKSFLAEGHRADPAGRGVEPFVAVEWPTALDLVARELSRVRAAYGNESVYGASYGWSSAGRFHHAQSQTHRFLNAVGGYVRAVQNYSYAAGEVILSHVLGGVNGLVAGHTPWSEIVGESELIVMFGGAATRNAQVNSGGVARHVVRAQLLAAREGGAAFVNVSPLRDDALDELGAHWLALRPNTDVALMLALAHVLLSEDLYDQRFLARYTVGFETFARYVRGEHDGVPKTPEWAAAITTIDADAIRALARRMSGAKTLVTVSWSLQRADHGEQPYWAALALACLLGGIGLPGRGIGFGYASAAGIGNPPAPVAWAALPQGSNAVKAFIPVARLTDMLLHPGETFDYNGAQHVYPHVRLVYWAGGNPFHHHQDLNKLVRAWRKPETIVVHESWWNAHARHADIVLPAATPVERNDIAAANRDGFLAASHRIVAPPGEARSDYEIFRDLAARMGVEPAFSEGRDEADWLRWLYARTAEKALAAGHRLPGFEAFWSQGVVELPPAPARPLLAGFRADPQAAPLATPSGKIELASEKIASFGYDDCPGHPAWLEPAEWLGATTAKRFPLHLLSNQPANKLHSQYDHGAHARAAKVNGREAIRMHPDDAAARGIRSGDIVRVFNVRGALLAGAVVTDAVTPRVVQMSTGAWYDPVEPGGLCKHGNPNALTRDRGTSRLSQGPSPNSCLVEMERYEGEPPPLTCYEPPDVDRSA